MHSGVVVALVVTGALVVLGAGLWFSRRHTLDNRVGSFRCSLARGPRWPSGVAQYGATSLYWWRSHSLAPRPAQRWERASLVVLGKRDSDVPGAPGQLVVRCRARSHAEAVEFELLLTREAYAGLTSWIEATPSRVGSVY